MTQKREFFPRGSGWNWADPSGYGVPGKPITPDQFYTEDVLRMLVPGDGLSPVATPIPLSPHLPGSSLGNLDSEIARDPAYTNDRKMEKLDPPPPDDFCRDRTKVRDTIETYRRFEQLLQEAVASLVAAASDQERAGWQEVVDERQAVLERYKPYYERAVRCTTSA